MTEDSAQETLFVWARQFQAMSNASAVSDSTIDRIGPQTLVKLLLSSESREQQRLKAYLLRFPAYRSLYSLFVRKLSYDASKALVAASDVESILKRKADSFVLAIKQNPIDRNQAIISLTVDESGMTLSDELFAQATQHDSVKQIVKAWLLHVNLDEKVDCLTFSQGKTLETTKSQWQVLVSADSDVYKLLTHPSAELYIIPKT